MNASLGSAVGRLPCIGVPAGFDRARDDHAVTTNPTHGVSNLFLGLSNSAQADYRNRESYGEADVEECMGGKSQHE